MNELFESKADGDVHFVLSFSGALLLGGRDLPDGFLDGGDRRRGISVAEQPSGRHVVHLFRACALDHRHLRTVCRKGVSATFLASAEGQQN